MAEDDGVLAVGEREATLEPHAVGRGEPDDPRVAREPKGHDGKACLLRLE